MDSFSYINGFLNSFSQGGTELIEAGKTGVTLAIYRATLVPWMWFLTCRQDSRIFQNKSVPDIIQEVFKGQGFADFRLQLNGDFKSREYCVQYRESNFDFVSRLMEEEGIFYFFEHEETKHTLVMANHHSSFKLLPKFPTVYYQPQEKGFQTEEMIKEWNVRQIVRPAIYTLRDFNFETPHTDLTSQVSGKDERKYEVYDYPGEYEKRGEGDRLVNIRLEEGETSLLEISGKSNCLAFVSGYRFDLKDHYRRDLNKSYVLTGFSCRCDQTNSFRSTDEHAAGLFEYSNQFQCIPYPIPFRPPRMTPTPVVHGSQTAMVVGPKGEEIYADKYGRVKVQFHWDRLGQENDKSSCWIRVSQGWAGKGWGMMAIPRIGQEVIIDFLEGNPDQPIITGRVYNADSMPPYNLPQEMTKSTVKSNSSKGGDGFNEIRFEDKKGSEQVFIFAQRNQDNRTQSDSLEFVGQDRHLIVKRDQFEIVEGDQHLRAKGDKNEKVEGTASLNAGTNIQIKVGQNYALDSGTEVHIKAGMNLVIESGTTLTLKVGGNFININSGGVFIKGSMVMINSGGAAGSGAGASPGGVTDAKEADSAKPGQVSAPPPPQQPPKSATASPAALVLKNAAQNGAPFCAT